MNIIKTENDNLEKIQYDNLETRTYIREIETNTYGLIKKYTTNLDDFDYPWYYFNIEGKVPREFSNENQKVVKREVLNMINKKNKIVIVEIGVHRNVYEETSTSIFIDNKRDKDIYIGIDIEDKSFLNNISKNIYTIQERSENIDIIISFLKSLNINEIDILMIDGWHSLNQVYKEWEYTKYLSNNGIIILHDTNAHPGPYFLLLSINQDIYEINKYCSDIYDYGISVVKKKNIIKLENRNTILIAHRGNIDGPNREKENSPEYIIEALNKGFNVEIDVHYINNEYWLGHDDPMYKIEESFLENPKLWCHAKNHGALYEMSKNKKIIYFYHENDSYTLTSNGYIWTFPNNIINSNSICVLPEVYNNISDIQLNICAGICSDYINNYK